MREELEVGAEVEGVLDERDDDAWLLLLWLWL